MKKKLKEWEHEIKYTITGGTKKHWKVNDEKTTKNQWKWGRTTCERWVSRDIYKVITNYAARSLTNWCI